MSSEHHQKHLVQDVDVDTSTAIDETQGAVVDEVRQYHPLRLEDLYSNLRHVERENRLRRLAARYWRKVQRRREHECWSWLGTIAGGGYGLLSYQHGRNLYAHRLAFIFEYGEIPRGAHVLHDCGDKSCVNPAHLKVGGDSENMLDAVRHGAHAHRVKLTASEWDEILERYLAGGVTYRQLAKEFGVSLTTIGNIVVRRRPRPKARRGDHPTARLSETQVVEARRRSAAGESWGTLAVELGVSQGVLRNAAYGRTWRELPGAVDPPGTPRGEENGASKLSEEEALEILRRVASGASQGEMARVYGVSRSTVSLLVNGKRWGYLQDRGRS